MMQTDDTAKLVRWLADIEAIKQLKHTYCGFCDAGYDADGIASLFTEDAVWDGGPMGTHDGREAIRTFFQGSSKRVPFALHMVVNPIIQVDGDTATGSWYLWQPMVYALPEGEHAYWMSARYDDRYRRTPQGWQFERVAITLKVLAPYEKGFAGNRIDDVYGRRKP
jgi:uncharacterized protein (TIGR02246 family)